MSALWTAAEAAAATGGRVVGDWRVEALAIDTRTLEPGSLFIALAGENRDGHAFVPAALEKGAVVMVARDDDLAATAPRLVVEDTLTGLEALGRAGRARTQARIAAVTGSVGKTGTKEALRHVLSAQGATHASVASYNNHWGVPLSLARMPADTRFGVFELGMNHEGEILTLTRQARPHVAVITRIAPAHLEYFGTLERIADAKAEIFAGLEPGGIAILPADDPQLPRLAEAARAAGAAILTFGTDERAHWRITSFDAAEPGSRLRFEHAGRAYDLVLAAPGRHWAGNALAVLAAATSLGAELEPAIAALAGFTPPSGRGARRTLDLPQGQALLLDESYNANPVSMQAAIEVLGQAKGRKIAVLGDMLELGPTAAMLHASLAASLTDAAVDLVFLAGPLMQTLFEALPARMHGVHAPTSADLTAPLLAALEPGDTILVKGSLGSRMKVVIEALGEAAAKADA